MVNHVGFEFGGHFRRIEVAHHGDVTEAETKDIAVVALYVGERHLFEVSDQFRGCFRITGVSLRIGIEVLRNGIAAERCRFI